MSDMQFNNIAFDMPKSQSNAIKVIGVGGGGSNAVNHMFSQNIKGVDFVICNTDAQALQSSPIPNKIQLGASLTSGLGAGANPEVGANAAEESCEEIKNVLTSQTKMVFITAGMGGGTGTGAAPIIAKVAKDLDILTVAIVTMPFQFEGRMRSKQAQQGIDTLRANVDSLIVINNNKLREVYGNLGFKAGFSKADEVLSTAARGIAEVITHHYKQNIDLHDAKTVLSNSGTAIMGSSKKAGNSRAKEAISSALDSPLLNDNKITGAKNVLLLIVSGVEEENEVTLDEIGEINDFIQSEAGFEANIIMGVGEDEALGDAIAVTVVATGFAADQQSNITNTEAKIVRHTLGGEQKAEYNFEQPGFAQPQVKTPTRVIPQEAPKVVHQLFEEEVVEEKVVHKLEEVKPVVEVSAPVAETPKQEEKQVVQEVISEEDFIIEDITAPDLFTEVAPKREEAKEVTLDLFQNTIDPVDIQFDMAKKEAEIKSAPPVVNVFDLPVVDAIEVVNDVVSEVEELVEVEKTPVSVFEPLSQEVKEEPAKPVYFTLEEEVEEKPKRENKKSAITVSSFDIEPTIKMSSTISKEIEEPVFREEKKVVQETVASPVQEDYSMDIVRKTSQVKETFENEESEEVSPLNLTISQLQRTSQKRKDMLKKYNYKFKNAINNTVNVDEIEREPAYKRLGVELQEKEEAIKMSRTSVGLDANDELTIRRNNSFLHDNVD